MVSRKKKQVQSETINITGVIGRSLFHNGINGYTILKLTVPGETDGFGESASMIVVGNMPTVRINDECTFAGNWIDDPKYGKQFKFQSYEVNLPSTNQGAAIYLADICNGVGSVKARKIIDEIKEKLPGIPPLEAIRNDPNILNESKVITPAQAKEISTAIMENIVLSEISSLICRDGITPALASKIYMEYGLDSLEVIKSNPYLLADSLFGVGFLKADAVASAVGIAKDSEYRIKAAIEYVIKQAANDGHCFLRPSGIMAALGNLLAMDGDLDVGLVKMANEKLIKDMKCIREGDAIYSFGLHLAETEVVQHMMRLVRQPVAVIADLDKMIEEVAG